ncbi:hypothetical protein LXT21_31415 [Myxococcus sp. K38C18041901]|uniref:hypothetical protein n=1 Tax=Myxococcus guangdongensis TaxID=2906760 RepID=UPI0020A82D6B|nr:hypothetical protein [Myxococcus guangdongensis]MCP3063297.1 hypothetical protein [Myxococcus guangdongensis]
MHKREARFAKHRVLRVAMLTGAGRELDEGGAVSGPRTRGASSDAPRTVTRHAW